MRRKRVTFLAKVRRTKREERRMLRRTKKYLRKSERVTPGFGTLRLQRPEYHKQRKLLRKSYRNRFGRFSKKRR